MCTELWWVQCPVEFEEEVYADDRTYCVEEVARAKRLGREGADTGGERLYSAAFTGTSRVTGIGCRGRGVRVARDGRAGG